MKYFKNLLTIFMSKLFERNGNNNKYNKYICTLDQFKLDT